MGQALLKPVELTRVQRTGSTGFRSAVADMQGWRNNHEDAHEMVAESSYGTFWVLDGHGGDGASIFCAPELAEVHSKLLAEKTRELPDDEKIRNAFIDVDVKYQTHCNTRDSAGLLPSAAGTTVVGASIVKKEDGTYSVKIMNAGDSRGLIIAAPDEEEANLSKIQRSRPDEVNEDLPEWPLLMESIDHKPDRDVEKARIVAAGGTVSGDDPPRLDGNLAVSRGMGDFEYKVDPDCPNKPFGERKVSCIPEVYEVHGLREGSIVVLACDGLWDVFKNHEVATMVRDELKENPAADLGVMSAQLVRKALERNSRDNITTMIVQLSDGTEWSKASNRFNDSDEMMYFDKLVTDGELDDDAWNHWKGFLQKCKFPAEPVQCATSGRWYRSMWKCPGTGNVYMSRHCQKKGWASHKKALANKEALEQEGECY